MHLLKKIILRPHDSMKMAIEALNYNPLPDVKIAKGIVLVADEHDALIGTITDGDIRRALISKYNLNSHLLDFMCTNPSCAIEGDNKQEILEKMKSLGIIHMPILNSLGQIIKLETLGQLLTNKKHDNTVFLMAGGFGKRLKPLTDKLPKPLINIGSKPILEIIIEQFIEHGFHNFIISTHFKASMITDYFGDGGKWNVQIKYVHEKEPLGTAGALGLLPKNMPDLPIIIMNGDILTKVNFNELLEYHNKNKAIATMCMRDYSFQVPYGVLKIQKNTIIDIVEKPTHNFFINAGIYVIDSKITSQVNGLHYLDMPTLMTNQIELNETVNSFPIHEYWMDIGRINELNKANQEVASMFNL